MPSDKALEQGLVKEVRRIWNSDKRAELSVNLVRQSVQKDLGLDEGFFKDGEWKAKSKDIIRKTVDELDNAAPKSPQIPPAAPPKRTPKKDSTPPKKRAKQSKGEGPSDGSSPVKRKRAVENNVVESDADDADDDAVEKDEQSSNNEDFEEPPSKKAKPAAKPKAKPIKKAAAAKLKKQPPVVESSPSEASLSVLESEEVEVGEPKVSETADPAASSSEESVVYDEPPPKRKRQSKEAPSKGPTKAKDKKNTSKAKVSSDLSPDEAEIKKLQGYLLKCGVRKIWAFELKEYGDNAKAKIRHLRDLLKEIGMDGRFSESRAREIKEQRELQADLEDVQAMNRNWGAGGGRAARSRAVQKSLKEPSDDEEKDAGKGDGKGDEQDEEDEDDDSEAEGDGKARVKGSARYRADFAFLNDDESDSD